MPMRFRRSVTIAPGVRVNIGKKGVGSVSVGGRGMRTTFGVDGRRTSSIGLPGTGVSRVTTTRRSAQRPAPPPPPPPPKPGTLAKPIEKRFYEGLDAYRRGDWAAAKAAFQKASEADPDAPSPYLFGGIAALIEARLRRLAKQQGLAVVKSRYRATAGTFGIIDPWYNAWVAMDGRDGYGMDLDDVDHWLSAYGHGPDKPVVSATE